MAETSKMSASQVILFVLAIALFGAGFWLALLEVAGGSVASTYGAGAIALVFSQLDRFRSFKAFGVEGELTEKVKEADDTIRHLRSLALVLGETTLWQVARMGRQGTPDTGHDILEIQAKVFSVLDKLGISTEDQEHAAREVRLLTRFDYVVALTGGSTSDYFPSEMRRERGKLFEDGTTPEKVRAFLEDVGQLGPNANPEVKLLFDDFEHYYNTGRHQRLDVFRDRTNWPEKYLRKKEELP